MSAALSWLQPLRCAVPELTVADWNSLCRLSDDLTALVVHAPPTETVDRSQWLLALRRCLAERDYRVPAGTSGLIWQALAQFCAGFHDLDLRDAVGPGHGGMVLAEAAEATVRLWRSRLGRGDLVGIAATERHGGSRIHEITTQARRCRDGSWLISGEKCWVSRLVEAAGFVVFFRDPDRRISAAIVDATGPGLSRDPVRPFGLGGWSWGVLRLQEVPINPARDLLGGAGSGLAVFHRHFARFRPLVTATALGAAAGVHTLTCEALGARHKLGILPRVRDNALITLGRTFAEIHAALLATINASRLAAAGHPDADVVTRTGKATGVDAAHRAVSDLAPLLGASGFAYTSPIAKARADLTGLLYADGIHDSLYRSGGVSLLRRTQAATEVLGQATGLPSSR